MRLIGIPDKKGDIDMRISDYKNRIIDKLSNNENYGYSPMQASNFYKSNFSLLPDDIVPNVIEWLEDKPFSDIDYYGLSIKQLQDYDKYFNNIDFRYDEYFRILSKYNKDNHPYNERNYYKSLLEIGLI